MGTGDPNGNEAYEDLGIVPRAVETLFQRISSLKAQGIQDRFTVRVSYLEIYNEELRDLLVETDGRVPVQIREDPKGRIYWTGVQEVLVRSPEDVMNQLSQGSWRRQTGSTDMNAHSSRSHAIFSITLKQEKCSAAGGGALGLGLGRGLRGRNVTTGLSSPSTSSIPGTRSPSRIGVRAGAGSSMGHSASSGLIPPRPTSSLSRRSDEGTGEDGPGGFVADGISTTAKFHFVDLAGSERLKRTNAVGDRAKEGISINAGLSALGNVISALGDPTKRGSHIPYRDSKLTRLLQDSLGGSSATWMIACVSPAMPNLAETLNTLKYANRARNIRNRMVKNEEMSTDVTWLQAQVMKLREELKGARAGGRSGRSGAISPRLGRSGAISPRSGGGPPSDADTDESLGSTGGGSSSHIPVPTSPTLRSRSPIGGRSMSLTPATRNGVSGVRSPSASRPVSPTHSEPSLSQSNRADGTGSAMGQAVPPALLRKMRRTEEELARVNSSYRHLLAKYDETCTQLKEVRSSQGYLGDDLGLGGGEDGDVSAFQRDMEPIIEDYEKIVANLEDRCKSLEEALARSEEEARKARDEVKFSEAVQASNAGVIAGLKDRIVELESQVEVAVSRIDLALNGQGTTTGSSSGPSGLPGTSSQNKVLEALGISGNEEEGEVRDLRAQVSELERRLMREASLDSGVTFDPSSPSSSPSGGLPLSLPSSSTVSGEGKEKKVKETPVWI